MRYAAARDRIRTGDLVALRSTHGGLPALTRWVTRSPYTHTAVAVWMGPRLLIAEAGAAGNVLAPLSHYEGTDFDVFACPVQVSEFQSALWDVLGARIRYDVADLLRIAAHRLLGVPLPERDEEGLICSALSATIYLHAGWTPADLPSIPAPDDVVYALGTPPRLAVRKD